MNPSHRRIFLRDLAISAGAGLGLASLAATRASAQGSGPGPTVPGLYNVRDFGAKGDGATKDTAAIQAAIEACARSGGGRVYFPNGKFLSGTITLRDNVTLFLDASAVLLGSPEAGDYAAKPFPARDLDVGGFEIWALIYADGAKNIGIEGTGLIDGNGKGFPPAKHTPDTAGTLRPRAIFLKACRQVRLSKFTVRESAMWSVHLALCEKVFVEGISVYSSFFVHQDGLVLDSCREVMVRDCFMSTYDDAFVIKSSFPQPCVNITITNCQATSRCAAMKFGTQSLGGFRNVSISNCAFANCGLGGVKFLTVDGGDLEDVVVSNITMTNVSAPLFFRLGNRGQDFGFKDVPRPRPIARLRNIVVSGIRATVAPFTGWPQHNQGLLVGATMGIAGLPGHPVEDITLENIHVTYPGGGTVADARRANIPEREANYPENTTFGVLPAYGLWLRHAQGITVRDMRLDLSGADSRPAVVCDDVEDVELRGLRAPMSGSEPLVRLRGTTGAMLRDCRPAGAMETFVAIEDAKCENIALLGNDLRKVRTPLMKTGGFAGSVEVVGNLGLEKQ